ncbi:hypothetical protein SESBI_29492 [Sesbania bispinosa]|nr:hypothetical protein SESBI_29492 [Sesbania bispinosa]
MRNPTSKSLTTRVPDQGPGPPSRLTPLHRQSPEAESTGPSSSVSSSARSSRLLPSLLAFATGSPVA